MVCCWKVLCAYLFILMPFKVFAPYKLRLLVTTTMQSSCMVHSDFTSRCWIFWLSQVAFFIQEIMPRVEMLIYSRTGLIPTSHVHLHDTENIRLACEIFRVRVCVCVHACISVHIWNLRARVILTQNVSTMIESSGEITSLLPLLPCIKCVKALEWNCCQELKTIQ